MLSGAPIITGNTLSDNRIHVSYASDAGRVADNTATGGAAGLVFTTGSPDVIDNVVEGARSRGVAIGPEAAPAFLGNRVCDNAQNLHVNELNATFERGAGNEICEDGLSQ